MRDIFVQTSNVNRFLAAVAALEGRGAPEASLCLVQGDAGLGKTKTGAWWAVQQEAVRVRLVNAGVTLDQHGGVTLDLLG